MGFLAAAIGVALIALVIDAIFTNAARTSS
jgi:hypothetical protein